MKIAGWTEEEGGPYAPTIVWEQSTIRFLDDLIAEQEISSDVFEEIEKALAKKVQRGEESQRVVIFLDNLDFPPLAVSLVEDTTEDHFYIVGVGLFI